MEDAEYITIRVSREAFDHLRRMAVTQGYLTSRGYDAVGDVAALVAATVQRLLVADAQPQPARRIEDDLTFK